MKKSIILATAALCALILVAGFTLLPDGGGNFAQGSPESVPAFGPDAARNASARIQEAKATTTVPLPEALSLFSVEEAFDAAKAEGKYVVFYFWASWCHNCADFNQEVLPNPAILEELNKSFTLVPVDYDNDPDQLVRVFRVRAVPYFIFIDGAGEPATVLPGAVDAPIFLTVLKYVSSGSYKDMEFDEFATSL
ncbi:MAG: thioredoxin fold domain-containing protein [Deltaproteobacteria bacterium]|jgi:thioredoxin-related protein|nr:thioredoxin fold domain-containing protein [Deltaproteobacteria bacterium]